MKKKKMSAAYALRLAKVSFGFVVVADIICR